MLREALVDEPRTWLSGEELIWRTGRFAFGFLGFGSGKTVQKQQRNDRVWCLLGYMSHNIWNLETTVFSQWPIM